MLKYKFIENYIIKINFRELIFTLYSEYGMVFYTRLDGYQQQNVCTNKSKLKRF